MTDLFAPAPTDNLLPYDGQVNDLGIVIDDADILYNALLTELPWQSDIVTLFAKTHVTTRQIVWMGDKGISYQYSGHARQAIAWTDSVFHVKRHIEQQLLKIGINIDFNSCLLNYYPSGSDGMGYHADDEKELGHQPVIASLSLGATRKFVFKHKKTQDKVELYLESGQLIVMHGETQRFWKHSITKTKTVEAGRISLTFRHMLSV
ncbi:alpha-ketoglutarate-dependent dioxygenase AlkB [Psychrobacter sp. APC 3426]|uniref:alpha-ketoglutarate-dependent dioxygenase AlkB family protein n=1 Tax=Psychrobacter sp. APC 3426 TaxID=3035177 RepID=UPI0025B53D03|nr:alpha-ketoglutarate-dependent dioxygenase AlkB [Psychrobacter sp. APC 3426]MDN3398556.1 alpha-ketoglutarate-dependent dioxygenase AlkB [Psychrobacter sp. APC 3426]